MRPIVAGASNQSTIVRFLDSVSGTPVTLVTGDTSGMGLWYRREGGSKSDITPVTTLSTVNAAHSASGLVYIGDGYVRIDPVDEVWAAGTDGVMIGGCATGMVVVAAYHPFTGIHPATEFTEARFSSLDNIDGKATSAVVTMAAIKTQVDEGLSGIDLDNLLSASGAAGDVATGSLWGQLLTTDGDFTNYVKGTESLQAIRDRGDTDWLTADVDGLATSAILTLANIRQQASDALSLIQLDHLLATSATDADIADGAFFAQMSASAGSWDTASNELPNPI